MEIVREARKAKGWTQEKLAAVVGLYQESISNLERGKRDPHISELRRIAKALDIKLIDLIRSDRV